MQKWNFLSVCLLKYAGHMLVILWQKSTLQMSSVCFDPTFSGTTLCAHYYFHCQLFSYFFLAVFQWILSSWGSDMADIPHLMAGEYVIMEDTRQPQTTTATDVPTLHQFLATTCKWYKAMHLHFQLNYKKTFQGSLEDLPHYQRKRAFHDVGVKELNNNPTSKGRQLIIVDHKVMLTH